MIQRSITPSDIEFLMHCHFLPGPHPQVTAPAIQSAILKFTRKGLIEPRGDATDLGEAYSTTALGKAWVKAICATPIPSEKDLDGGLVIRSGKATSGFQGR